MTKELKKLKTKHVIHNKIRRFGERIIYCVLFIIYFLFIVSFTPVQAQIDLTSGYKLQSNNEELEIIIDPNIFIRTAHTSLQETNDYPPLPLDKILISKVYYYSFLPATDNLLEAPITITALYSTNETRYKEIFIYDEPTNSWRHLTSTIDIEKNKLNVSTLRASGYVAVLADKLERSEYIKENLNSPTILVTDAQTKEILIERNSQVARPIASLTKLMTAAVFLDNNPGWDKKIAIKSTDDTIPSKIYVKVGDKISTRDLFFATLVHSANNAAKALARSTGLSTSAFVEKMNTKAKELGMKNSHFAEPTGLSKDNISTAEDYLKLTENLLKNEIFLKATTVKNYKLSVIRGKKTIKMTVANSNKILNSPYIITGSKTGYTTEAGRCLMIRAKNANNREVIAIIMGADMPGAQWSDMNSLLAATLDNKNNYTIASSQ